MSNPWIKKPLIPAFCEKPSVLEDTHIQFKGRNHLQDVPFLKRNTNSWPFVVDTWGMTLKSPSHELSHPSSPPKTAWQNQGAERKLSSMTANHAVPPEWGCQFLPMFHHTMELSYIPPPDQLLWPRPSGKSKCSTNENSWRAPACSECSWPGPVERLNPPESQGLKEWDESKLGYPLVI